MFFFNKKFKQLEAMIEEIESNLLRRIQYYESQTMSAVARVDEAVRAVHNMVANVDYIQDKQHDIVLKLNELKGIIDVLVQEPGVTTEIISDTKPRLYKSESENTFSTKEVSKLLRIPVRTLRNWVSTVGIPVKKDSANDYHFTQADIEVLNQIQRHRELGKPLYEFDLVKETEQPNTPENLKFSFKRGRPEGME